MVNVSSTAQALSDYYTSKGIWVGLATADPGSSTTPNPGSEVTVGAGPGQGYARQQTMWGSGSGGVNTGSAVTFNVPAGVYTYMILATDSDPTKANMFDNCPISANVNGNGQLVVVPEYTQT
jgi:hypothetical protein